MRAVRLTSVCVALLPLFVTPLEAHTRRRPRMPSAGVMIEFSIKSA